jgi:lipopolysaccharide transport system ATP-binding protein
LVRHTVEIPGDFLNTGTYYVNAMIVKDASVGVLVKNGTAAFEVVEGKIVGNWYGRRPGAVRPKLKWQTEIIETGYIASSTEVGTAS